MRTIKQAKWGYVLCSVLLCCAGIALIVCPAMSASIVCYIVGAVFALYGIAKIIGYFSNDTYNLAFQFDLALGIFVIVIGLVLILHPAAVLGLIQVVIGLFVFIDGLFKLQTAIDAHHFGLPRWWLILIGSILCIALGLLIVFNPFPAAWVLTVFIGISLLADGLQNLFNAVYTVKYIKRAERNIDNE